jgi:hypothetical protein
MNTFKKKSLSAAVLAGLGALGAAGSADAVHLNPDGLGQVLIYPYYTSRASLNTAMTVVNTTNQTKLVKVRFLEGRNSREVLDFNLFLSPNDVWAGVVVNTADAARLVTNDNSCVTPNALWTGTDPGTGRPFSEFKNFEYSGPRADSGPISLDRTREGYVEVIEMGVITNTQITGYVKHNSAGVPANCAALDALDPASGSPVVFPSTFLVPPSGGLAGRALVINAAAGANYAYDATALDAWSNVVQYTAAGQITPALSQATPPVSNVFIGGGNVNAQWATGRDAVSATMMRNTVLNEFVLDAGTNSSTDWVVTFPTKRDYVSAGTGAALPPFNQNFNMPTATTGGSCDAYGVGVYNREEGAPGAPTTIILPSPLAPVQQAAGSVLCWEANVIPFKAGASLLGSVNVNNLVDGVQSFVSGATTTPAASTGSTGTNGPNGWLVMSFNGATQGLTPITASLNGTPLVSGRHTGLPLISMAFTNFTRTGVISTYGLVSQARYTRNVAP